MDGQQIVSRLMNEFLTKSYPIDLTFRESSIGKEMHVSYLNFDDSDYVERHKQFLLKHCEKLILVIEHFVPFWSKTEWNWCVTLHADKCILMIKGDSYVAAHALSKKESGPAVRYARIRKHLVDRRFGDLVNWDDPNASQKIAAAQRKIDLRAERTMAAKKALVEEFRGARGPSKSTAQASVSQLLPPHPF